MNKSVMKCCICDNENIGQFITINNKKYHLCCIENLQKESQKQKEVIDKIKNVQIEMPKSNYSYDYMIYRNKIDEILKEVSE